MTRSGTESGCSGSPQENSVLQNWSTTLGRELLEQFFDGDGAPYVLLTPASGDIVATEDFTVRSDGDESVTTIGPVSMVLFTGRSPES